MRKKLKNPRYLLAILILLSVFLYSGRKLISYYGEGAQTQAQYDELSEILYEATPTEDPAAPTFDWSSLERLPAEEIIQMPDSPYVIVTNEATGKLEVMLPEYESLFQINPDIVGWITIPGTRVDYPVVQRKEETDYYLYRDFYGNQAARGCIYVKEACDVFAPTDNIIMYGHMMNDFSMFGDLSNYTRKKYWMEHPYIQFNTLRARHTYEIICVFKVSAGSSDGFAYHNFVNAETDADWDEFWSNCRKHAYYDTGLDLNHGDKLITLSTCEYTLKNGRMVIVARLVE